LVPAALAHFLLAALVALPGLGPKDPRLSLWMFGRSLQNRQLTADEAQAVTGYLAALPRSSELRDAAGKTQFMMDALSVGKVAPEITGRDLNGVPFSLSDYRGKVVLLTFSGDWCGICRAQYPVERRLQELYGSGQAPFVILSVDSGASAEASRAALAREGLTYRAWWDGGGEKSTVGPIATKWNVVGWPATYVIDPAGVIRHVDLLQTELFNAVEALIKTSGVVSRRNETGNDTRRRSNK
jgi:peroxiredoxin